MSSLKDVERLEDLTVGQLFAFCLRAGGLEVVKGTLSDELALRVEAVIAKFFDKNGQVVLPQGLKARHCDPNREFYRTLPEEVAEEIVSAERFLRFQEHLGREAGISLEEVRERTRELIARLERDERLKNALRGVYLPVIVPKVAAKRLNYGRVLEERFLPALERAYKARFPDRHFENWRKGELEGQVSIVGGSRHDQLVEELKDGPVVGIFFPNPMQGYSIHAQRELMKTLPESFMLGGGFDSIAAAIMWPDVIARDYHVPGLDMSALSWRSAGPSLCLAPCDVRLRFDYWADLADAYDRYSGGLLFRG